MSFVIDESWYQDYLYWSVVADSILHDMVTCAVSQEQRDSSAVLLNKAIERRDYCFAMLTSKTVEVVPDFGLEFPDDLSDLDVPGIPFSHYE